VIGLQVDLLDVGMLIGHRRDGVVVRRVGVDVGDQRATQDDTGTLLAQKGEVLQDLAV